LSLVDQVNELLLRRVLDCARVEEASVCIVHRINDRESIVLEKACHVLAIGDVVRAAVCFDKYFCFAWKTFTVWAMLGDFGGCLSFFGLFCSCFLLNTLVVLLNEKQRLES
jgi:hypothetical protein